MSKRNFFKKYKKNLTDPKHLSGSIYTQVHRIKIEYCESCILFNLLFNLILFSNRKLTDSNDPFRASLLK